MWGSVLLLEGLGVPGENHKYLANVHLRGRNHLTVLWREINFYSHETLIRLLFLDMENQEIVFMSFENCRVSLFYFYFFHVDLSSIFLFGYIH